MSRDDSRFDRRMKRFLAKKGGRSLRASASYGREAEGLLYEKQKRFDHGTDRIVDIIPGKRQEIIERLESCELKIDQQLPLATAEEQRLWEAAESWRDRHDLERLEVGEAPDRQGLFAWVTGIASLEAVWTWTIMAPSFQNWLLDGVLVLAPPVLTLVLAYLASIAVDNARRGSWGSRVWAALSALPVVASGLAVHLLAGHYRDDPSGNFIERAMSGPLAFESAASMWLFFFGAVAFVFVLYKLVRARDPVYVYADRLRRWDEAKREIPALIVNLEDKLQAALHGTIDDAASLVKRDKEDVGKAIVIAETALRRLGVLDPGTWEPPDGEEADPAGAEPAIIVPLVAKWRYFHQLKSALLAIGDVRIRLGTRDGEEPGDPPREIDKLPEAVRLSEALDWFRRYLDGLGMASPESREDSGVVGHA